MSSNPGNPAKQGVAYCRLRTDFWHEQLCMLCIQACVQWANAVFPAICTLSYVISDVFNHVVYLFLVCERKQQPKVRTREISPAIPGLLEYNSQTAAHAL